MARKLADILADLDVMLEKRAQEKQDSVPAASEDDGEIEKLAEDFLDFEPEASSNEVIELNEAEKIAHSMAIVETLLCGSDLKKACAFEKEALRRGASTEDISATLTKFANKTEAGNKVYQFMKGFGHGIADMTDAVAKKVPSESKAQVAGRLTGIAAPFAAAGGLGAYAGSKAKEKQMKTRLGIR